MSGEQRASIFSEDETDLSAFQPRPAAVPDPAKKERVREVSETANFRSREPKPTSAATAVAPPHRAHRRHRTGRNVQLNIKVRQEALDKFYQLADQTELVLGEVFERALAALARELDG